MSAALDRAKEKLVHYIWLALDGAGRNWDHDNEDEVREIIDEIHSDMMAEVAGAINRHVSAYHSGEA